jgi:hypothetical protein
MPRRVKLSIACSPFVFVRRAMLRTPAALTFVLAVIAVPAHASGADATSDCLPPQNSAYLAQNVLPYANGILLRNPIYHQFTACDSPPPAGSTSTLSIGAEARFDISTDGGITWIPEAAPAHMSMIVQSCTRDSICGCPCGQFCYQCGLGGPTCLGPGEGCIAGAVPVASIAPQRDLDIELLQLDISGGTLLPGLLIRESPTMISPGSATITDLGGGSFHIDGFFYVVAELSLDNGQTWASSNSPGRVDLGPDPLGPTRTRASTWGALKLLYR